MTPKIDPIHEQAQRELIVMLLRAYGVKGDFTDMNHRQLKAELEAAMSGTNLYADTRL
jgi:hypothetical protein